MGHTWKMFSLTELRQETLFSILLFYHIRYLFEGIKILNGGVFFTVCKERDKRVHREYEVVGLFQYVLWKKNIFFDIDIVVKNKSNVV